MTTRGPKRGIDDGLREEARLQPRGLLISCVREAIGASGAAARTQHDSVGASPGRARAADVGRAALE
eukprot:1503131-Lingulodinium_polyedra.AAC.1